MATADDSASTEDFVRLARALVAPVGTQPTLQEISAQATLLVPARWAAALVADRITTTPATLAATTDECVTSVIASIAAEAGTSPGWTAFDEGVVCHVDDLSREGRFGSYPARMVERTAVRTVLSVPLIGRQRVLGVLTMYGDRAGAFGRAEIERATLLASQAGVALTGAGSQDLVANLERALASSRTIGAAVGILVERHRLREDQAFDVLRTASQLTNHKVAELAEVLVSTGRLAREDAALVAVQSSGDAHVGS